MINAVKKAGLTFATMGECLGDDPANWYRDPSTGGAVANVTKYFLKNNGSASSSNLTSTIPTAVASGNFGAQSSGTPSPNLPNTTTEGKKNSAAVSTSSRSVLSLMLSLAGLVLVHLAL
jgi:hypothetical protein